MYAHFEVVVLVDRFRNLDLFHQGEYSIGCRVFGGQSSLITPQSSSLPVYCRTFPTHANTPPVPPGS